MLSPFYHVLWPVRSYLICFAEVGLCLLKKPGMACAFPVWELFTSVDVEAENERSVFCHVSSNLSGLALGGCWEVQFSPELSAHSWYRNYSLAL